MSNFQTWFDKNLKEEAKDISNHGAGAGFPHITYYSDTTEIFDEHENDILEMLAECADSQGIKTTELMASFGRSEMFEGFFNTLKHDDQSKQLLVWFGVEELSHRLDI